eukprot:jgi/Tetstr1/464428/TSEL_000101.t1
MMSPSPGGWENKLSLDKTAVTVIRDVLKIARRRQPLYATVARCQEKWPVLAQQHHVAILKVSEETDAADDPYRLSDNMDVVIDDGGSGSKHTLVFVASEVAPWSKTGGLGDVMGSLPAALANRGHRVMVIAPRYGEYVDAVDTG